ncbi:MAG: hypothetical protein IJ400_04615 [Clostridia bacterium]|nr:hypothetical protein [Clostridia bacterium]
MALSDELRGFEKSAEQIKREKKEEVKRIVGQLLVDNLDNWASYIFEMVKSDIKKKAEQGFFQIIGKDKKEIVGVTELRSEANGFYNTHDGMRCNVHPCYKISIDEKTRELLEGGFDRNAKSKDSNVCMPCMGVGVLLVDNSIWCQRLYFTREEKLLFFIKLGGKPKTEYVETLMERVQELGLRENIKIKLQAESGCVKANYSIKY